MATLSSLLSGIRPTDTRRPDESATASSGRVRISPAVSVEFVYRDLELKVPPRVDCTVLFAGPHLEQILTAYAEAVRLFSEIHEPAKLLERVQVWASIQNIYESRLTDGKVCIEMREAVFRKRGPVEDLNFSLRILAGRRTLFLPGTIRALCRSRQSLSAAAGSS